MRLLALAAVLSMMLSIGLVDAADDAQQQPKRIQLQKLQKGQLQQRQVQPAQFQFGRGGGGPLLAPEAIEKLKFTAEQKEKYEKVNTEYTDKAKAAGEKLREAFQSKDAQKIQEAFQNARTDGEKLRTDYLGKVEAFLTADQKKTFEEVKNQRPQGIRPFPGAGGFGGGGTPGQVLSTRVQDQLKLTDEQKKKVEELQKEIDNKINSILNDEQKKQLEEIKKGGARRPGVNLPNLNLQDLQKNLKNLRPKAKPGGE